MASARRTSGRALLIAAGILAAAAIAFGIGRFTAFGAPASAPPANDSADAGFARDMQVHHAQAVEMAMTIFRTTDDPGLRALAYDIATGQAAQSGQMYEWLVQWGLPQSDGPPMSWMAGDSGGHGGHGASSAPESDADLRAAMGMASPEELAQLSAASGQAAECLFTKLMIRHHEGAIRMIDAVLEAGRQPRVLETAAAMAAGQSSEITALRSMQAERSCSG